MIKRLPRHEAVLTLGLFIGSFIQPFLSNASAQSVLPRIINGTPVAASKSGIVKVLQRKGRQLFLCTGEILAPKAVLTASHCVSRRAGNMSVMIAGKTFSVRTVKIDPNVREDRNGLIFNDVAVLLLNRPTSKPKLSLLLSRAPAIGDMVTVAGFGLDEFGNAGRLRQGVAILSNVSSDFVITRFSSLDQSDPCSGDSGGPALFSYTDSSGVQRTGIIGTVSSGTSSRCGLGDMTVYINMQSSTVLEFIRRHVRAVKVE